MMLEECSRSMSWLDADVDILHVKKMT
jgi:hypothetical protein